MSTNTEILFIIMDSARRDRVSAYGHDRPTTPTLESFASEATVFENAYTPTPWTLPSHCSMFTGQFPSEHGVTNGFADRRPAVPTSIETIPQRLSSAGYRTAGFSNNPWVGKLSGLDRGFDEFVEWDLEIGKESNADVHTQRHRLYSRFHSLLGQAARQPVFLLKRPFFTRNLSERAQRWVESTASGTRPTFTFLNLMEAHSPYFPPKSAFESLGLEPPGSFEPRFLNTRLLTYTMGNTTLTGSTRDRVLEFYDASLRYEDEKIGEILDTYREQGRYEDSLIVICSDHGKTLGEFPRDGHPPHYVRELNGHVPLLVKFPGQTSGRRIEDPVELTDLFDLFVTHAEGDLSARRTTRPTGDDMTRPYALTEDYIPHTGSEQSNVTRWRILSNQTHRYAQSDDGDEYVFERGASVTDETVVSDPRSTHESVLTEFSTALDDRIERFTEASESGSVDDEIEGTVRSQLHDLGYL